MIKGRLGDLTACCSRSPRVKGKIFWPTRGKWHRTASPWFSGSWTCYLLESNAMPNLTSSVWMTPHWSPTWLNARLAAFFSGPFPFLTHTLTHTHLCTHTLHNPSLPGLKDQKRQGGSRQPCQPLENKHLNGQMKKKNMYCAMIVHI